MYNVEGKVTKLARKYVTILKENGYESKVLMNDATKDWQIGDTVTFQAEAEWKYNPKTRSQYLAYYIPQTNKDEIERWKGYVLKSLHESDRLYGKGMEKLRELNATEALKEIEVEHEKALQRLYNKEVQRWLGYCQNHYDDYGTPYLKGEQMLKQLGATEELKSLYDYAKESYERRKPQEIKRERERYVSNSSNQANTIYQNG